MATLEKIRSKGTFLLIVVGLAILAFVIGDFLGSGSTYFQESRNNVAKINGQKIKAMDFMNSIEQMRKVYEMEMGQASLNDEATNQMRESVWETTVRSKIIGDEAKAMGMMVTKNELTDQIVGSHISPYITTRPVFMNQDGVFDRNQLINFLSIIDGEQSAQIPAEELQNWRNYWMFWERLIKENRIEEKYTSLISEAIAVTPLEAKYAFDGGKTSADIVYAMKSYYAIADSTVNVSDSEIKARYNKEKEQFRQEANANIKYVAFDIKPSQEDFDDVESWITKLKDEFASTSDIAGVTNGNSDVTYSGVNLTKDDVDKDFAEFAFSGKKDEVSGPIFVNNTYKMARIVETGISSPDSVKLRNIVLFRQTPDETQALADSIETALLAGSDFAQLAEEHSLAQNARNGGEIGWVRENEVTKEIADKAFYTSTNGYFHVKEGNAIIIFNVEEIGGKADKVKLAVISREVMPSSRTQADIYAEAKKFAVENNTLEKMESAAKEGNLNLRSANNININATRINDVNQAREVVRWAFENKAGTVSDVFECGDKLVVAGINSVHEKGYKSVDDVKSRLMTEIRREKKGDMLVEQMKGKTMEELAADNFATDTVRGVNFNSTYAGSIGNEPALFAQVASAKEGELSQPIKGNMGAFVYKVISKTESSAPYNEKEEMAMLSERQRYMNSYLIIDALKKAADIEDFRYRYF